MDPVTVFLLGWLACGILAYGLTLGFFQNRYPEVRDKGADFSFAMLIGLSGPIGLIATLFSGGIKYGLKFIPEGPVGGSWY